MKYFFLLLFSSVTLLANAQSHQIEIELPKFANQKIYLGYYYGNLKGLQDSLILDNQGKGVFKGDQPLNKGIYFLVSPRREIMFEVVIPEKQQFKISSPSETYPYNVQFEGSTDNHLFHQYSLQASYYGQILNRLYNISDPSPLVKDSIKTFQSKIEEARDKLIQNDPNSMISLFFKAMEEPTLPPSIKKPNGSIDTVQARKYFKDNFWGPIDFTDPIYIRSPFFETKLNTYFEKIVAPVADSIIHEVDYILAFASVNEEMYRFMMLYFINKYIQPQYMGQDAVFVHLFEKYIAPGKVNFLPKENLEMLSNRAYSLMANLIGKPAAELDLIDLNGKNISLYKIQAPYTVICFWDPACSHCKELMPKLDSLYQNEWKKHGIALLAVNIANDLKLWKDYIQKENISSWIHGYRDEAAEQKLIASQQPGYKQLYDIYQTPLLYLLDSDKRILAKRLTYEQLNDILKLKLKQ